MQKLKSNDSKSPKILFIKPPDRFLENEFVYHQLGIHYLQSFLDNFRNLFLLSKQFLGDKLSLLDVIMEEFEKLPAGSKETPETLKFQEVIQVYYAMFDTYLDILNEFIQQFEQRIKDFDKQLMQKRLEKS